MNVYGLVGLPGSGKSEAAAVASELEIPVVTMGDVIRAECRNRGLDPATDHGQVATALRDEHGEGAIARESLPHIEEALTEHDTVVVDGIRSGVEVDRFEAEFGDDFTLVSIEAPFEVRAKRLELRGRDAGGDDGGETLDERDQRELEFGMDEAIDQADITVENNGTLDAFKETIRSILTDT